MDGSYDDGHIFAQGKRRKISDETRAGWAFVIIKNGDGESDASFFKDISRCSNSPVSFLAKTALWATLLYLPFTALAQMAVLLPIKLSSA